MRKDQWPTAATCRRSPLRGRPRHPALLAAALLALACATATPAQAPLPDATAPAPAEALTPEARAAAEAQAKQQLTAVRDAMRKVAAEREATEGARAQLVGDLRAAELEVARVDRELRDLDARLAGRQLEIDALVAQESALQARLEAQREAVAALLRSAFALGRHAELRLWFAPEDMAEVGRLLAYHRYLQRDRTERIRALAADLVALAEARRALEAARAALAADRTAREGELAALAASRSQREAAIAALDAALGDQAARLAALGKDERDVQSLIERLRDAIADVPRTLAGAEPLDTRRGRLPWPAGGRVLDAFGSPGADGRRSSGVLIGARSGAEVRAIAHGRVAYADWLRGYGLLVIVDHGDGWMSLYAHHETLRREVGDWVDAGDVLGTAGASGGQSRAGLYFELRHDGRPVDPGRWLAARQ